MPPGGMAAVLESTLWNRQLGALSEELVAALVCQIFEGGSEPDLLCSRLIIYLKMLLWRPFRWTPPEVWRASSRRDMRLSFTHDRYEES